MSIIQQQITSGAGVLYHDYRARVVTDLSGNSNDGSFNSAPLFSRAGLALDGADDSITVGDTSATIKTFVIMLTPNSTSEDIADFDGGTHTLEVGAGTITATGWATPVIYVDAAVTSTLAAGTEQIIGVTTGTGFAADSVKIGQETTFFNGNIAAVFMSTDTLDITQVAQITGELRDARWPQKASSKIRSDVTPPSTFSPAASWNLYPVTNLAAEAVASNDGILNTGLSYNRAIIGDSMTFPGVSGAAIQVPDADELDVGTADFSLVFWIKTTAAGIGRIIDKRTAEFGDPGVGYTVGIDAAGKVIGGIGDGTTSISDETILYNAAVNDGLWHLVIAEFDRDGNARATVDTITGANTSIATASSTLNNATDLYIGQQSFAAAEPFDGELAYPTLYKKILSATEKNYLFDLGSRAIPFKTDWGVNQSVANVTSGQIENSVFTRSTGTHKIGTSTIQGNLIKTLENVAAGVAYTDVLGKQSTTQAAYGEWEFWIYKGADGNEPYVLFVSDTIGNAAVGSQNGYYLKIDSNEALIIGETTNGSETDIYSTANSYITNAQWTKIRITRSFANAFTIYIDDVTAPASGASGSNPFTDSTHVVGQYFNTDLDAGDLIGYAGLKGDYGIRTSQTLSVGASAAG